MIGRGHLLPGVHLGEVAQAGGGQVGAVLGVEDPGRLQPRPHDRPHEVGPHLHRVELQPPRLVEAALRRAAAGEPGSVNLALDVILRNRCLRMQLLTKYAMCPEG